MRKKDIKIGGEYLAENSSGTRAIVRVVSDEAWNFCGLSYARRVVPNNSAHTVEVVQVLAGRTLGRVANPKNPTWGHAQEGQSFYVSNREIKEPWTDAVKQRLADEEDARKAAEQAKSERRARAAVLDKRAKPLGLVVVDYSNLRTQVIGEDKVARVIELLETHGWK